MLKYPLPCNSYNMGGDDSDSGSGSGGGKVKDMSPGFVVDNSLSDWYVGPAPAAVTHQLSHTHRKFAQLVVAGMPDRELASFFGISSREVASLKARPQVKAEIAKVHDQVYADDHYKVLKVLTHRAIDTIVEIMEDPEAKRSERLDAAKWIAEKATGKAVQAIQVQSSTLSDVFDKLDSLEKSGKLIDVIPSAPSKVAELNAPAVEKKESVRLDEWVTAFAASKVVTQSD